MNLSPMVPKRKLRERKPPLAPPPDHLHSDLEVTAPTKRRNTASRSANKQQEEAAQPDQPDLTLAAADDVADQGFKKAKRKLNSKANPSKDKDKAGENKKNKKKQRSVVRGDTGGVEEEQEDEDDAVLEEEEEEEEDLQEAAGETEPQKEVLRVGMKSSSEALLVGDPIDEAEATKKDIGSLLLGQTPENLPARRHYSCCKVDGVIFQLYDDAYVMAGVGKPYYICRIVEIFEGVDRKAYFTAQWFFRAEDTAIKQCADKQDKRRLFWSEDKNDNLLESIVSKLRIVCVEPNIDLISKVKALPECDYYYDMLYAAPYSTFKNLSPETDMPEVSTSVLNKANFDFEPHSLVKKSLHLLDLYSGCGGMSTGLCLGAALSGIDLETTWAVDLNHHACNSLQRNHPRTQVRNEKAENFLALLKEWAKLVDECNSRNECKVDTSAELEDVDSDDDDGPELSKDIFEVDKLINICYGDPQKLGNVGIHFLVHWKGYDIEHDSWEPMDNLGNAKEKITEFILNGYKTNILPLPGTVDVICGGPPCQGISGYNRFRNVANPFDDEKNLQMAIFMDIVSYLKPRYVLMENVVDILRFSDGFVGRYALSRLVEMNYQARLGLMVAGCYGLPQFRMRMFLFGALPTEVLPQFPLPTHNVVKRGAAPKEFESHVVALDESADRSVLKTELFLVDAISDLPAVTNNESREEMPYGEGPMNDFQKYIRLSRNEMSDHSFRHEEQEQKLLDHQPLKLNEDDYARVCKIPKRKGANFRDLEGVLVGADKKCYLNKAIKRPKLPSGNFLVPDYAISYLHGKSLKCFGRLWWDETVSTVVTRAEPHNQIILHPNQDRVLTIRENARLQGFPDYYKFSGPLKQRYMQVGNAVAVPVARALGYALARALRKIASDDPLFTLPSNFYHPTRTEQ